MNTRSSVLAKVRRDDRILRRYAGMSRGLMIVTMKDVGGWRFCCRELHDGALKEDPAIGLIGIVLGRLRDRSRFRRDRKSGHCRSGRRLRRVRAACHVDVVRKFSKPSGLACRPATGYGSKPNFCEIDGAIARNNDADVDAELFERQRAARR